MGNIKKHDVERGGGMYKIVVTDDRFGHYEEEEQVLRVIGSRPDIHGFYIVGGSKRRS